MSGSSIVLLLVVALILFVVVRRVLQARSIANCRPSDLPENPAKDQKIILLDVRTAAERAQGAIPGSIHIPLQELSRRLGELEKYRSRKVICYCQSGSRSVSATLLLTKSGFTAMNLVGGIAEWNFSRLK
jgi:rhodanese-related sulfurtransferase